jgi:TetR/AcrR family transcriptional repressor of mexJK operon
LEATEVTTKGSRADKKRKAILDAATKVFLEKGYDGASMDDVANRATVSKPTVYKHFQDKSQLYAAIVRATTDQVDEIVRTMATALAGTPETESGLVELASLFLEALTQPQVLRLRRMIIANADRFPTVARSWYDEGFGRVLTNLAKVFEDLAKAGRLRVADPQLAANHFAGLVLWIPLNRAMFGAGNPDMTAEDVRQYASAAVRVFLKGYQ